MKSFLTIFVFGLIICEINSLEFKDCGSVVGKFTNIAISDCNTDLSACPLKRNTNATIAIDFEALADIDDAVSVVHGNIMGVDIPFPIKNPDACVDSGIECPLKSGSNYKFSATLEVKKAYPKVHVEVKWEIRSKSDGKNIVCVKIPAKIE